MPTCTAGGLPESNLPPGIRGALAEGQLRPVPAIAEAELGHAVDPRTVLRWAVNGRAGVKLPTIRGTRRRHYTTCAAFRAWLAATSGVPVSAGATPPTDRDDAADAVLAALNPRLARGA